MNITELRQNIIERLPDLETKGFAEVPNQKFWDYYRGNKVSLKEANIIVKRSADNIWYIIDRIGKLIKKHPPKCEDCGKHRELVRKAAKGDSIQYYWVCVDCNKMSGAIPHVLSEHLIQNEGQTVYDFDELKKQILIGKLKKGHSPECEDCGKHRELVRKAARDDTIQYFWDCIDCVKKSGAIPHELAEYLIEKEGQVVRDIE